MTLSFLVALGAVVTIEMPISGAVKVFLSHVTPKIKTVSSSKKTFMKNDQDNYSGHNEDIYSNGKGGVYSVTNAQILPTPIHSEKNGIQHNGWKEDKL